MFYLGKISALTAAICAMCAVHLSVAAEDVSPNSANNPPENAKKTTPEDFDGIAFLSDGNYKNSERTKTAIRSATGSLEAGMPALAQAIIEEFLSKSSPDENLREDLTAVYADALIAQGNFELAQKQISQIKEAANSPRNKIRKALIAIGLNRHDLADEFLEGIDPSEVGADDIVWYHLAKGYALFESSKLQDALKEFEAAKKSAKSQYALADAQIAINICKLSDDFKGAKLDEIEKDLSDKVRFYMGTPAGFQFAKQYAAVLFKLGKNDEAIEVINQQLGIQLAQDIDKDELRVIAAAMTKNRQKQSEMLQEILNTTSSAGVAEYALSLLAKSPDTQPQNFEEFLENIAKNGSPRICDRILLEIAKLRLKKGSAERAAETASKLRIIPRPRPLCPPSFDGKTSATTVFTSTTTGISIAAIGFSVVVLGGNGDYTCFSGRGPRVCHGRARRVRQRGSHKMAGVLCSPGGLCVSYPQRMAGCRGFRIFVGRQT